MLGDMAEARRRIARVVGVVAVLLLGAALVGAVFVKTGAETSAAVRDSERYDPPQVSTPPPPPLPLVAVIGDDTTAVSAPGVTAAQRWPELLGSREDVEVRTFASAGAGYLTKGSDGRSFLEQARRIPKDTDVVIVFGGIADVDASQSGLSRAIARTISTAQSRAPDSEIAVVGPVSSADSSSQAATDLRLVLQNQVGQFGQQFIDPVQRAWLSGVYESGRDLGREEESAIADQMVVVTSKLLPQQN